MPVFGRRRHQSLVSHVADLQTVVIIIRYLEPAVSSRDGKGLTLPTIGNGGSNDGLMRLTVCHQTAQNTLSISH